MGYGTVGGCLTWLIVLILIFVGFLVWWSTANIP